MKVIIITEGYQSTGYGHITRCLSLYQAFEEKNIMPLMIINGDEGARQFLGDARFELHNWLADPEYIYNIAAGAHIVIIDSYKAGAEIYEGIHKKVKCLAAIDDFLRLDYDADVIINGTIGAPDFGYVRKEGISYLLGGNFIPLRREFRNVPEKIISPSIERILITFGGQDVRDLTGPVLEYLLGKAPYIKYSVVVKENFKINFKKYTSRGNVEFIFDADAEKMKELMLACDAAVTAGGQTIYELARTGLPSIAVAVADNQIKNMQQWVKSGFIEEELYYNDPNLLDRIGSLIAGLNNQVKRENLNRLGINTIDGEGAVRIASLLKGTVELPLHFRSAREEDAKLVFDLSNDPVVRKNSINWNSIGWQEHIEWFGRKIKESNYLFHLYFTDKNEFAGQVRFNIDDDIAVISISIVSEFRGKGLAHRMLTLSCGEVFGRFAEIKRIDAFIKKENLPSVSGFARAGFKPAGEQLIDGDPYYLYILLR